MRVASRARRVREAPGALLAAALLCLSVFGATVSSGAVRVEAQSSSHAPGSVGVSFLPLDERFTTRDAFLNLARVAPSLSVATPPPSMLPLQKRPCSVEALNAWLAAQLAARDAVGDNRTHAVVMSAEMYLYGGLIASRVSNDTTAQVTARAETLVQLANKYPTVRFYVSSVVMRIPSYSESVEEPDYWATYGLDLYTYSYYTDKYSHTHDPVDLAKAQAAEAKVPPPVVAKFLWRRKRNFNVTVDLLHSLASSVSQGAPVFEYFYVTLDDNAQYGFNIEEANQLRTLVQQLKLQDRVLIYPGADEVGLTLLARMSVDVLGGGNEPSMRLVFRNVSSIGLIPNYEGQPMIETLKDQIKAAGAAVVNDTSADVAMLVNNFSELPQLEASQQPTSGFSPDNYSMFDAVVCASTSEMSRHAAATVVGFADNRYSNGGDLGLSEYMAQRVGNASCGGVPMSRFAYAGWNTDGNTLGTVIANTVLLALVERTAETEAANTYFNTLRLVEDVHYQAQLRQRLAAYVYQVPADSVTNLAAQGDGDLGLSFYVNYAYKVLKARTADIATTYGVPWELEALWYPWNRTFEIGLNASSSGGAARGHEAEL